MSDAPARLITLPPHPECETARWLLDHYRVPYREERHTPFFLFGALRKAAGTSEYPLFQRADLTLTTWEPIFNHFEAQAEHEDRLTTDDPVESETLRAQIDRCHRVLAEETLRWAFWYLLPKRDLTNAAFAFGAPWYERLMVNTLYFSVRIVMQRGLHTGGEIAKEAGEKLRATYDDLDDLLADGRPYLNGERFSLLDLLVCANAGLTVMPAEYGAPLPALQALPEALCSQVEAFRERPTGRYLLRLFAERRHPPTA